MTDEAESKVEAASLFHKERTAENGCKITMTEVMDGWRLTAFEPDGVTQRWAVTYHANLADAEREFELAEKPFTVDESAPI
jgi:hypothetical protein